MGFFIFCQLLSWRGGEGADGAGGGEWLSGGGEGL